jgi:hypothetical protein
LDAHAMNLTCITSPRRVLVALLALGAMLVAGSGTASSALAVGCYGDYCSGRDPEATGCSADAFTIANDDFFANNHQLDFIELRWSPTCKTEWARVRSDYGRSFNWMRVVQSTGYTQWTIGNNGTYAWTAMIYSPRLCVRAEVSAVELGHTACV